MTARSSTLCSQSVARRERPLTADGRILFFSCPQLAATALALDRSLAELGPAPEELETFCDIAEALHRVNSQNTDPDGVVLLVLDDLVPRPSCICPIVIREF